MDKKIPAWTSFIWQRGSRYGKTNCTDKYKEKEMTYIKLKEKKKLDEDTLDLFDDLLQELACYPQEVVSDKDYKQVEDIYFKLGGEWAELI